MASTLAQVSDIGGLNPAVDPKKSGKYRLLEGENVYFDVDGIISGFGNDLVIDRPFANPVGIQGIRINTEVGTLCFTFTDDAILMYSEIQGTYIPLLPIPSTFNTPYRWTLGYLNDYVYMCHPVVGVIRYHVVNEYAAFHTPEGIPEHPLAICVDNGRLAVLSRENITWSDQSNGFNFELALGGSGFQKANDRISGIPIICFSYGKGIIVLTTGGILRGEFTGDKAVYRWRGVNTQYYPINSLCAFQTTDDEIVFLDPRGFYVTRGESPKPYLPLWNEFLIAELKRNRYLESDNIRVEWDSLNKLIYTSFTIADTGDTYDYAYVLYQPIDKWGKFSDKHYGILPWSIDTSERRGDYFGFVDESKRPRYWGGQPHKILTGTNGSSVYRKRTVDYPTTYDSELEVYTFSSQALMDDKIDVDTAEPEGYYTYDNLNPVNKVRTGLSASLSVGLFRFGEGQYPDELSEVTNITVGSVMAIEDTTPIEDFNLVPDGIDDEDYNEVTGADDYGFGRVNFVNFNLQVIGSMDGRSAYVTESPVLYDFFSAQRYYACNVLGLHQIVNMSADIAGETFHLQTLELNGILAGRIR